MPRVARKSLDTSFFHIMVQGINKEYIFNEEYEMQKKGFINEKVLNLCFENIDGDYIQEMINNYECYNFIGYLDEKVQVPDKIIDKFKDDNNIKSEQIIKDKRMLAKLAIELYNKCNIKQNEIAKLLGVNRLKIHRILKNEL